MAIIKIEQIKNPRVIKDRVGRVKDIMTEKVESKVVAKAKHTVTKDLKLTDRNGQPHVWATPMYIDHMVRHQGIKIIGMSGFDELIARITNVEILSNFQQLKEICTNYISGNETDRENAELKKKLAELESKKESKKKPKKEDKE